jgi:hypothetical protein
MRSNKMVSVQNKTCFHNMLVVDCMDRSGGLTLLWNNDAGIEIQYYSRRHINAKVSSPRGGVRSSRGSMVILKRIRG